MTNGDVETVDTGGQWVNRVIGEPKRSESSFTEKEVIEEGQTLAEQLVTLHAVLGPHERHHRSAAIAPVVE